MSHFSAAVIIKNIEDLEATLAPYDENLEVEPYIEKTSQEIIKEAKERLLEIDDYNLTEYAELLRKCKTDEDFLRAYVEYWDDEKYDFNHNLLSTYNPNSKWDYWILCEANSYARFKNKNMPKGYCKVKDFIITPDPVEYAKAIREWELIVEEKPLKDGKEKPFSFYKPQYYIDTYKTKEKYAEIIATPHTWAFVLNGKWCEKGNMGWWGMNDANNESIEAYLKVFKEVITNEDYQDYYIAVVDCHI